MLRGDDNKKCRLERYDTSSGSWVIEREGTESECRRTQAMIFTKDYRAKMKVVEIVGVPV